MNIKLRLNKKKTPLTEAQRPGPGHQKSTYEQKGEVIEFDGWGGATDPQTGDSGAVVETDADDLKIQKHLEKEKKAGKINGKGVLLGSTSGSKAWTVKIKRNR